MLFGLHRTVNWNDRGLDGVREPTPKRPRASKSHGCHGLFPFFLRIMKWFDVNTTAFVAFFVAVPSLRLWDIIQDLFARVSQEFQEQCHPLQGSWNSFQLCRSHRTPEKVFSVKSWHWKAFYWWNNWLPTQYWVHYWFTFKNMSMLPRSHPKKFHILLKINVAFNVIFLKH